MKLSVLLCVYNSEKYLKSSIESILNQTYRNFELIIIEDGSNDNSLNILKKYMKKDSRIKIYKNEINKGLIYSLNKGLKICKGEYIARMDADDISNNRRFEKQVKYLDENLEIDLVGSRMRVFKDTFDKIKIPFGKKMESDEIGVELLFGNKIYHPTVMFRKQILDQNKGYNKEYFRREDYGLWLNFIKNKNKMIVMKDLLLDYRLVKNSESHKTLIDKKSNIILEKIFQNELYFSKEESEIHAKIILNHREIQINDLKKIENHLQSIIEKNKKYNLFDEKKLIKKLHNIYLLNSIILKNYYHYKKSSVFKKELVNLKTFLYYKFLYRIKKSIKRIVR